MTIKPIFICRNRAKVDSFRLFYMQKSEMKIENAYRYEQKNHPFS